MDIKLFTLDKNYLLKEAQLQLKNKLLRELVSTVKEIYIRDYNPLGIIDDVIIAIQTSDQERLECLENFYSELAGIYRYKYGRNQLEFLFDGSLHIEKYSKEWIRQFRKWTLEFCSQKHFLKAVLEGAILSPGPSTDQYILIRLKLFLEQFFGLRIYKYHGIRKIQAA